jgi:hypothetical protein
MPLQDLLGTYISFMKEAGFDGEKPVYVASGIFSYANETGPQSQQDQPYYLKEVFVQNL